MGKTVLIVEDHPVMASLVSIRVRKMGHTVAAQVRSGQQAIAQATAQPPDLVIMDIRLAGELTGPQTVAQIRDFQQVPVLYFSTSIDLLDRERAKAPAHTEFLAKSSSAAKFQESIEQLIGSYPPPPVDGREPGTPNEQ